MNSFHNCFPLRTTQFNCKDKHSPHITKALLNSIKEENRLEKLASKWPVTFKEQYRTYQNKLTSISKAAKKLILSRPTCTQPRQPEVTLEIHK